MKITLILSIVVVVLAILIFYIVSEWKVFVKAGKPGWACLVPFYNGWTMAEIAGKPGWWGLIIGFSFSSRNLGALNSFEIVIFGIIAYVVFVVWMLIALGIAKSFGKSTAFGFLLGLFPIVGYPILAFGKAKYLGGPTKESKLVIAITLTTLGLLVTAITIGIILLLIPLANRSIQNVERQNDIKSIQSAVKLYETNVSALLPTTTRNTNAKQVTICADSSCQGQAYSGLVFYNANAISFRSYSNNLENSNVNAVYLVDNAVCNQAGNALASTTVHEVAILYALETRSGHESKCSNVPSYTYQDASAFPYCGDVPTSTMSLTAYQYLTAAIALNQLRKPISDNIQSAGNMATPDIIQAQLTADEQFLTQISKINYPPSIQADALAQQNAIKNYDRLITTEDVDYNDEPATLNQELVTARSARSAAADVIREDLNLPVSTCSFNEP